MSSNLLVLTRTGVFGYIERHARVLMATRGVLIERASCRAFERRVNRVI